MWDAWLDLALGGECVVCQCPGRALCRACDADLPSCGIRVRPDPEPDGLAPTFAAGRYADPLRAVVIAHKEHHVFALARPLGEVLAGVVQAVVTHDVDLALVPVPSTPSTIRERGHDPLARMVRIAATRLSGQGRRATYAPLLRQYRPVLDQAGLSAGDRLANLDGSLAVATDALRKLAGRRVAVVICDDVVTTGATVREAQRALAEVGLEVAGIAAVAATERRQPMKQLPDRYRTPSAS